MGEASIKAQAKTAYETAIGVEVHIELATKTKLFCGCEASFGAKPNTHVCPYCLGMPGTLPVLNEKALELALSVGIALHCDIPEWSRFDRKNYFYPDNPQNYQVSQWFYPLCKEGYVEIGEDAPKRIGIWNIHLEEDAGKLFHDEKTDQTLVDANRAGVPLIEIVSAPDMQSAEEVLAFLEQLRTKVLYLQASDCKLQEGSMRVDVNLSVRKAGESGLGTRTEMKNLNSFRAITRAINAERERQIGILEAGGEITPETRRWDDAKGASFPMRSKEEAMDYRYFPDPDLPPVFVTSDQVEALKKAQPEMREAKRKRFVSQFGIPEYDSEILTQSVRLANLFEETAKLGIAPKKVSNFLMGEGLRILREKELDPANVQATPEHFAALLKLLEENKITNTVAKEVFEEVFVSDVDPAEYVERNGLMTVREEGVLRQTVESVIKENEKSASDYLGGKEKALGFLVGQTMKAMRGQADPATVTALLKELLKK